MLASFDSSTMINVPFRQRLDWCLDDVKAEFEADERVGWHWILKPSVTNKGLDSKLIRGSKILHYILFDLFLRDYKLLA